MKKNLLKSLLLTLMVLVGGSAWADTGNAVVKATYISGTDADVDTSFGEIAAGEAVYCGYNKISGGAVGLGNKGWGVNNIAYLQVDASAIEGTITGATLSVDCQQISARGLNYGVGYNTSEWSSTLTWNTADRSITTMGAVVNGAKTTADKHIDFDIKDAFKDDADKIVTILVYQTAAGGGYIKNPAVTIEYTNAATANYTVKYMCGETVLKDSVTRTGIVGEKVALETGDDAAVYANDKKYIYTGSNIADVTIAGDGSSVIIVNFREAATYNYSLLSSLGSTIATGSGFEGDNVAVGYPRYALAEGVFYEAAKNGSEYRSTIALSADNASANVTYTAKEGINAVFFAEGENIDGMTVASNDNIPIRASNALAAIAAEDVTITTLPVGKYIFHTGIFTSKSGYSSLKVNFGIGNRTFAAAFGAVNMNEIASEEYVVAEGTAIKYLASSSANTQFDYIWIEKTGEPTAEELDSVAAVEALIAAKAAFQEDINAAKAIDTIGKNGAAELAAAITAAEAALAAEDATVESIAAAKEELAKAVKAFNKANMPDLSTIIANADFSADEAITTKICTYAKDVKEGEVANMQPLTGWTIVENGDARAAGVFAYGSAAILGGDGGNVPAAGPNGETEGKVLGIEAVWSATTQYTQDITLPAGDYLFEAAVYNAAGTGALASNLIGIDGTYSTIKSYPVGKWTKDQVKITLTEEKTVTVSIGVNSGNVGNAAAPHLFIDYVKLYGSDEIAAIELAAAKENALAEVNVLPVGDALFLYAETAINTAKNSIEAATTIEEVNAALATAKASMTKPAADKAYAITNTTADGNLCITTGNVTVAKDATVFFAEVEGGYVLYNKDNEYILKTSANTWTLSTTTNKDEAYVVNFYLADGAYTIKGANGLFGLDNTTEGSTVYANKAQSNNGLWTIAEYVAPEPVKTDYTEYIVNADLKGEGGFDASETKGFDGSGIVKVSSGKVIDFKQTIANLPAGKYKVTAQAAYRYSGNEADEAAAIAAGTETKFAKLYATVGTTTVDTLVQNRWDGASDTDYANGNGSVTVNEKFVPNSSSAVQAWFNAGQYVNEVVFNLPADGAVTIGIVKTAQPEASDYVVIGPWTLTRLGDAEAEPEPEPEIKPGDDVTKFIVNNSFESGNLNGWTVGNSADTGVKPNSNGTYTTEGCDGDYVFNTWWQGIPITQTVKGLPNGLYELKALMANDAITAGNQPCLYLLANGQHSAAFSSPNAGTFAEGSMQFYVTDGTATIGAIGGNADGTFNEAGYYWYKADNFRLKYVEAMPNIEDVEIPEGKMSIAAADAMTAAKEAGDVVALIQAVNNAKSSIAAYAHVKEVLDFVAEEAAKTNVYTAAAKEKFDSICTATLKGYNEGTISDADANAFNAGSRLGGLLPELFLSAYTSTVEGTPYINTWSVEGNTDGSEFRTPFYEYWVGDNDALAANVITAKVEGVEPGDYEVSAWVRVRIKNGAEAPATSITLNAGNDNVTIAGTQIGTSPLYAGEYKVNATVAENGILTFNFNVAADGNVSWLSFKNVKFEKKEAQVDSTLIKAKEALQAAIAKAEALNTETRTAESVATLTAAITTAKEALAAADATVESLNSAQKAIEDAIAGLKYAPLELAEGTIYAWQAGQEGGGTAVGTDPARVAYANAGYTTISLNGKADFSTDYVTITLTDSLIEGDVIKVTAYRNKNAADKTSGFKAKFDKGGEVASTTGLEFVNIDASDASATDSNRGTEPNTCTFLVPAQAQGSKVITITRSHTGTNLFITALAITKGEIATGINTVKAGKLYDGTIYNLNGQKVNKAQKGLYIINGKRVVVK